MVCPYKIVKGISKAVERGLYEGEWKSEVTV